jgi:hypothetical protein
MRISRHDLRRRYSNSLVIDAGSQFSLRACSQAMGTLAKGAPDIVSGQIIQPDNPATDSNKIVLSGIRPDIYYYQAR